jgi:hypothetical protein
LFLNPFIVRGQLVRASVVESLSIRDWCLAIRYGIVVERFLASASDTVVNRSLSDSVRLGPSWHTMSMAEGNGIGGRLDRVEAILGRLAQERDHEDFTRDHKQLMTWQVLMQEKMDRWAEDRQITEKHLTALSEKTDQRIGELVNAIGKLIHGDRESSRA